jgi:SM-20-related protein
MDRSNMEGIVEALATTGWCVLPQFCTESLVDRLVETERCLWDSGAFRPAGIGSGKASVRPEVRRDRICWLDPDALPESVTEYWAFMEAFRLAANRSLYLGLRHFEAHFAVYPPGAFYRRHLDQFRDAPHRILSCILYLNRAWTPDDDGRLRIYPTDSPDGTFVDVLPRAGTFVCFRSDTIEHEVLPANRDRLSLTGWLRK